MIAIMDYGIGNLGSIKNALDYLGYPATITNDKDIILSADKVILPGVGAFNDAITTFKSYGFEEVVKKLIEKNTPILGICVGMQLLFDLSHEFGTHKGLGLLRGEFEIFKSNKKEDKIPQIGWNQIEVIKENPLLKDVNLKDVYFVHSYYLTHDDIENAIAKTTYAGITYTSAVRKGNLYAVQFHPEKSGMVGLQILKNFCNL